MCAIPLGVVSGRPRWRFGHQGKVDDAVQAYIDAITSEHRPLFDRIHGLIMEVKPEAEVVISCQMPTYKVGRCRFYLAVWKHGVSFYGWGDGRDGGFAARHPDLTSSKGTIKLRPLDAAAITDDEIRARARSGGSHGVNGSPTRAAHERFVSMAMEQPVTPVERPMVSGVGEPDEFGAWSTPTDEHRNGQAVRDSVGFGDGDAGR